MFFNYIFYNYIFYNNIFFSSLIPALAAADIYPAAFLNNSYLDMVISKAKLLDESVKTDVIFMYYYELL